MTVASDARRPVDAAPPPAIDIASKVRFLGNPASYPERLARVDIVETHYSWVFLTDCHAYKLKKPVRGRGFDFSTAEQRRRNAAAEWRLNRRLAGDVYLGVVPLCLDAEGGLAIGGAGVPVDWLVKMVRLPAGRMFDRRIAGGALRHGEIEPIARHLAAFFAGARRARAATPQFSARIKAELADTLRVISAARQPRILAAAKPVVRRLEAFLVRRAGLLRRRVRERRLVDGHGDLRPEHVYVNGTPRIIDCLEFRADLRQLDPVGELAYLALECRRRGGPAILAPLLRRYREHTGDRPDAELVHFYTALNAVIRARIAVRHLDEPGARSPEQWTRLAADYLTTAAAACRFLSR